MKELHILTIALLLSINSFAQRNSKVHNYPINCTGQHQFVSGMGNHNEKISGGSETLSNIPDTAALTLYTVGSTDDSGFVTGTDYWNDLAFAERYDFNSGDGDSSIQVIGLFAQFGGTVNPASTQMATFNVWDLNEPVSISDSLSYGSFPNNILDSFSVPFTQLGIGATADSMKMFLFPLPTLNLSGAFFIGYSLNYSFPALNGDTIGIACSYNGIRKTPSYTVKTNYDIYGDTLYDSMINVQNATMGADYNWYDNYTQNDSLFNDLAIYPIVTVSGPTSVKGITRNDLTFYGNYPNPAVSSTNIRFSLSATANVSIQITDMAGHRVKTIKENDLAGGTHTIPVNTAGLTPGDYLYLIRTSGGGGMGGKMTVIRQ